jgi:ABC-type sugar transport system permease subunit
MACTGTNLHYVAPSLLLLLLLLLLLVVVSVVVSVYSTDLFNIVAYCM